MDPSALTISGGDNENKKEVSGIGAFPLFNPYHRSHKYLALFFICFLSFGSYFCYDNPAALADKIEKDMDVTANEYTLLYSLYSWPNTVLCFFGGFLIDRVFGVRLGALFFSAFCILGQAIFASGALLGPSGYWLMEVGRFVFGIGGESLAVAQNTYSVMWFKDAELNMVFGLQLSFSRVGSTVNMNVMTPIYNNFVESYPDLENYQSLALSLYVGVGMCIFSFICGVLLAFIDIRACKYVEREVVKTEEPVRITDVRYFPLSFWLISIICVAYYSAVFPFIAVGKIFFIGKFAFSDSSASLINSIVYFISAGASPIFGIMVDKFGWNVYFLLISVVGTLCSHFLLAFTWITPWFAMVLMGVTYSLCACALWPMVALIIPGHQLGTAYGIMQSIQNLGLALATLLCGAILEASGYLMQEIFFICCMFVALIATTVLYLVDDYFSVGLNLSTKERRRREEAKAEMEAKLAPTEGQIGDEDEAEEVDADALLKPRSSSSVRNRFYSKVSADLDPEDAASFRYSHSRTLSRRSLVQ